jgi:hypothetical protein
MAVDPAGDVYVTDTGNQQILDLPAGASSPTALPFTDLANPAGLALDSAGDVFVSNASATVVELPVAAPATAPAISGVAPGVGPISGGSVVTVTGSGFTGATSVSFGPAGHASTFTVDSDSQITVTAPAYAAGGKVHIRVTTPLGTSATTPADLFRYGSPPAVSGISPAAGPLGGGTVVTITGRNLTGASKVTFGAAAATSVTVNSDSSITATAPAGTGNAHVRITTPVGLSPAVTADLFHYVPAPAVTSLSPAVGSSTGGASVTITGSGFTGATAVRFGSVTATFTVSSATRITATVPAQVAGTVDVTVTTPNGTSAATAGDQFAYFATPAVTAVAPNVGPTTGGTSVTITGTGLTGATKVSFGATAATSFTVNLDGSITATSPAGTGNVHVRVMTPGGQSAATSADLFKYGAVPAVSGLTPAAGPGSGGTVLTITGTGLTGATKVTFGAISATTYTVNSDSSITVTAPAGTGSVHVRVTTPVGTSATGTHDLFKYTS